MARGKNQLQMYTSKKGRRASIDGPASTMNGGHCHPSSSSGQLICPDNAISNNPQEVLDAIEFHWKNLSLDLKQFLLKSPHELSLRKFVTFWTAPSRVDNTSPNIAASICGCSWYLALNYMSIGRIVEARALTLNGCFLQQCYNKPIEDIAAVSQSLSGDQFREHVPFFTDGLLAISTKERMSAFLSTKVSSDYQRRMSFATHTVQSKKNVQDYVNQISNDWDNGNASNVKQKKDRRRRASVDSMPADSFIEIKLVDARTKKEENMRYGLSMNLKSLFKKYAEDRNLSLRQLRFSYEGRTLFLSSVGNKTPQDLGIQHLDSIYVIDTDNSSTSEKESSSSSSDESKENSQPKINGNRQKKCRRASWAGADIIGVEERLRLKHSQQLSKVFTEVAPQFEQIRQKLNAMKLTCSLPKVKGGKKKMPVAIQSIPVNNPTGDGLGCKAGVPFYSVHVGEADNLYKITKPLQGKSISIDLHGFTKEEALSELDAKLPEWVNIAMSGSYPWVISTVIICGGGNQILSQAVAQWIKCNDHVAKAPKRKYSRRRTVG